MAKRKPYYLHELSHTDLNNISVILNRNDKWKELASDHLGWSLTRILGFQGKQNSTYEMLWEWAQQNSTVLQLFQYLSKMEQYYAMNFLKDYVGSEYHYLMNEGEKPAGAEYLEKSPVSANEEARKSPSIDKSSSPQPSSSHNSPNLYFQRPIKREPMQQTELGVVCEDFKSHCSVTKSDLDKDFRKQPISKIPLDPKNFNRQESNSALTSKVMDFPRCASISPHGSHLSPPVVLESANPPMSLDDNTKVPDLTEISNPSSRLNADPKSAAEPPRSREASPNSLIGDAMLPYTPHKDIEKATDNFSQQKVLGKGGFGVVYEGYLQKTKVAIKRIIKKVNPGVDPSFEEAKLQQSFVELKTLNRYRHDNILPLYAYSLTENELCLIYQYMVNGSLEDRLRRKNGTAALTWKQRLHIACGSARGIQYLHNCDKKIVHGDIKSANILLDEHMAPKIGDFGLAREGPVSDTHTMVSAVHGTQPYLPLDYIRNKQLSTKVDTYSFGVVLFEIATGLRAYNEDLSKRLLRDYVMDAKPTLLDQMIDKKAGEEMKETFWYLVDMGTKCAAEKKIKRPEMTIVFEELENFRQNLEDKQSLIDCYRDYVPDGYPYASGLSTDYRDQIVSLASSLTDCQIPQCVQESFQTTAGNSSFGLSSNIGNSKLESRPRNLPILTELGTKDD